MSGAETTDFTKVIPSEEIIQYLHPSLLHLDYASNGVQLSIIGITLSLYVMVFFLLLAIFNMSGLFTQMSLKHRTFMSLAACRGIFGSSCIVLGGYAFFKYTNLDRDIILGKTATSYFGMTYTVAFFIFEVSAVVVSDIVFKSFSRMLLAHHSVALFTYGLALVLNSNHYFGMCGLVLEMSTPFSCLCFVMLKAKMERSIAWKVNQLVLIHSFHLRSVVECYLWYITYWNWEHIWTYMPKLLFVFLYLSLVMVTFWMTPYWGYKKTQQLFNPVDWNFQESRNTSTIVNGEVKKEA